MKWYLSCLPTPRYEPSIGVQLDWARMWWMFHDYTALGAPIIHAQLQGYQVVMGTWGLTDFYESMRDTMTAYSYEWSRFVFSADFAGVCSGSNCYP
jgi:hypothetical protein